MYYTDGSGSISAISLDGANRTSPLKQLKKYLPNLAAGENTVRKGGGGAGSNGPAIFGNGFGFAAGNSSAQGATNISS